MQRRRVAAHASRNGTAFREALTSKRTSAGTWWPSWRDGCGCKQINAWRTPDAGKRGAQRVKVDPHHRRHQWYRLGRGGSSCRPLGENIAIVGRNETRTKIATARIRAAAGKGATVGTFFADLSSQAAVRKLATEVLARYPRLDVLINNAGAMYTTREVTDDGIELTWAVNHLAPFLLTTLLLDRIKASTPSRIITTATEAHHGADIPFDDLNADKSYGGFARYKQTKLASILFTSELARRLDGSGVAAHCFHQGWWRAVSTATMAC
jgi:NAD(P)-dependent dehydrogenase (short-subunit alcohol dehydrogenase family)